MAADEKWYFTKEQLASTPSRRYGFDADKELSYRQQAANFIQDMGQRLVVSQLCINTAIVYMHRFYVFHSLTQFHRNAIAAAALFLAAKVEEQPRKLEHVIKVAHLCLHREQPALDTKSEAQDLVFNENVLLQTLGFDVAIDHPHTHVVRCCHLVKASKDLAQTSYFMASNSLHLTTMCLQYKPTVVACFCIHLACKWSNWEIPQSNEGKHWFWYVDRTVTSELLQQLTAEFLHIFDRCPSRLKRKIMSISANQSPNMSHPSLPSSPLGMEPRKIQSPVSALDGGPTFQSNRPHHGERSDDKKTSASASGRPPVDYREYREKKERERLDREKAAAAAQGHAHHHKPVPSGAQIPGKHPVPPGQKPHIHHNHHHNRPDLKPGALVPAQQIPPSSRHSLNNQAPRESVRDPARQRIPREYNSSSGTSGGTVFTHGHGPSAPDNSAPSSSIVDSILGRAEQGMTADTASHNAQDKQGNNSHSAAHAAHHSADNKHLQPQQQQTGDKRQYDPARHKPPEHRKEEQKLYGKYAAESSRIERQRTQPDIIEQRSEEVRKIIEKPIPPPMTAQKTRQEIQKEEYVANMIKQAHHHGKYGMEKLQSNPVVVLNQIKGFAKEKSPGNVNVPPAQQMMGKPKPIQGQFAAHHGVTQIMKDNSRNGNAQSATAQSTQMPVNVDDIKVEKKPTSEDLLRMALAYTTAHQPPPAGKHRSLFSPEKTVVQTRESSHLQRAKPKQKTPPSAARNIKQEPIGVKQEPLDLISPFASPPGTIEHLPSFNKRAVNEVPPSSSNKRHRASSICEPEQTPRVKVEDQAGLDAMKMLGRVPELIQPIRDNPTSSNGKSSSVANDLKPPDLIKPFEPEPLAANPSPIVQGSGMTQRPFSNGYDASRVPGQESHDSQYPYDKNVADANVMQQMQHQQPQVTAHSLPPNMSWTDRIAEAPVAGTATIQNAVAPVIEEKRSEHHKSEKKKKKDKHKHKDKDKSKEERKHKHKHKDREKDRHHRDKDKAGEDVSATAGSASTTAIPIKITIPKDKINLGAGGDAGHPASHGPSEGSSLKIKILKERLKGGENQGEAQVQAPLKIKIRTGGSTLGNNVDVRKRERESDAGSPTTGGPPPMKKHTQANVVAGTAPGMTANYAQQRPGAMERQQNGRHYTSGPAGNNKEKHSSSYYKTLSKSSSQHSSHPT
ncbi:cyclin-T isoform X2 [Athalia rosae]|uniref:cyclin-T isoform X2 n=1 Tax=Athalia rosae TaxID=37344 RepID=UPI002034085F|nr:cyclin-T isoform X2 [Athalia rosae]